MLSVAMANPTTDKIDSLRSALEEHPINSTTKVDLLNELGYYHWIVDPLQSIIYGKRALTISSGLDYLNGKAFGNRVIGVAYWAKGDMDDASSYLYKSVTQYRELSDKLGEANSLMNLGLVYADLGNNVRALDLYEDAYDIFAALGEDSRIATTYTKIGTVYLNKGSLDSAMLFLEQAHRIHEKNGYEYGVGEVLNRLGIHAFKQGDLHAASNYFHEAIEIGIEINDLHGQAKNYADLSRVYIAQGKLEDAENLLQLGVGIAQDIGVSKWLRLMFYELRQVYELAGQLERSLHYFDLYVALKDSLMDRQMVSNLIAFETEIATLEQQNQLAETRRVLSANRLAAGLVVAVLVILVLLVYVALVRIRTKMKTREAETLKLGRELEYRNKELTAYALNLAQKNQLFEDLGAEIELVKKEGPKEMVKSINTLEKYVTKHHQVDKDWEDFRIRFESIHEGFFDRLLAKNPSLTNYELRLCALIRLNFSMKEIGNILGISADSVKTARYRLKKKLDLGTEETLNEYLIALVRG